MGRLPECNRNETEEGRIRHMWQELIDGVRQQQAFLDMLTMSWTAEYASEGGQIFCGRGCSGCCNLAVDTTFTEAVAIAGTLSEQEAGAVRRHVARLRERTAGITGLKAYLQLHRREIGFCPLLEEGGACGVYRFRPLSCRALLSTKESRWCATDFSQLAAHEKEAFVASLDRSVVAYPMHYVESTRQAGQEMENLAGRRMIERCGFSIYGNLPVLVSLARDHGLADACAAGYDAAARIIAQAGLDNPLLLNMER